MAGRDKDAGKIEEKLTEFVRRARESAGSGIEAIVLFGSAVSGDFHPGLSDLNLFCVLRESSFAALETLAPAVKWWSGQKEPPPLCMTIAELRRSTDVFTIELLDMVQHHRVLYGEDPLSGLQISTRSHRVQVEYELREKLVLLRQHLLLSAESDSRLWDVLLHSAPSFATLFRHALMVVGGESVAGRREAIQSLSLRLHSDLSAVQQVLEARENKGARAANVKDLCARYLAAIEQVTAAVDKALDSPTGG
jgi:nucleotidyltransferase-like protein